MEEISIQKQATLQKRSEIKDLLKEAKDHHDQCEAARASVASAQRLALWHAWQAGIRLNRMKVLIGRGDWLAWLDLNFCKPLEISVRTAQVYMKIDRDNADLREKAKTQRVAPTEADFQLLTELKSDTIRKYAFGFIPKKHEPNKDKDIKFGRLISFLNIVNEYNRIKYRQITERQAVDFVETRKETAELYQFLQWLHGDAPCNPWDSSDYDRWRNQLTRRKSEAITEIDTQRFQAICALR
jgi:hypothetical protein